jgi:hypothetical protein
VSGIVGFAFIEIKSNLEFTDERETALQRER